MKRKNLKKFGDTKVKVLPSNEIRKNIILLKISPSFRPKLGEEQKKRSSPKISPIFCPKLGEEQKKKECRPETNGPNIPFV